MTNLKADAVIADNDAHLENRRKYYAISLSNLVLFILEIIVILTTQVFYSGTTKQSIFLFKETQLHNTPIYISGYFLDIGWLLCFTLQAAFVIRGLSFVPQKPHYKNCLLLKIKFSFGVLCILLTMSILMYSLLFADNAFKYSIFTVGSFAILKLQLHYLIYAQVKYKDDARDVVTVWDFLTIHCTFSVFNAWISYQLLFVIFTTLTVLCPGPEEQDKSSLAWCKRMAEGLTEQEYYYRMFVQPSKFAYLLIFAEMSCYMAYYKDVIFGLITLLNYSGMLFNTNRQDDAH